MKFSPSPVSINKVLLGHSHTDMFTCCLWLPFATKAGMSNCDRDHNEPQSQQYLLSDVLQKKVCQPFEIRLGLLSKCLK